MQALRTAVFNLAVVDLERPVGEMDGVEICRALRQAADAHEGTSLAARFIPFLLMIVGFFPISVSLVIALESFVGEKERFSLEPLLASPLTDLQLYFGKMLAAMLPPLAASYMGIAVYLVGLYFFKGWVPPLILLVLILLLATLPCCSRVRYLYQDEDQQQ